MGLRVKQAFEARWGDGGHHGNERVRDPCEVRRGREMIEGLLLRVTQGCGVSRCCLIRRISGERAGELVSVGFCGSFGNALGASGIKYGDRRAGSGYKSGKNGPNGPQRGLQMIAILKGTVTGRNRQRREWAYGGRSSGLRRKASVDSGYTEKVPPKAGRKLR